MRIVLAYVTSIAVGMATGLGAVALGVPLPLALVIEVLVEVPFAVGAFALAYEGI